jgi:cyanophycin synthetase
LVEALNQFDHRRRTLVFAASNRRDADVMEMGAVIGEGFDRVILYRGTSNLDSDADELNGILRRGLNTGKRLTETIAVESERAAIETALADLRSGDLLVLGVDAIEESLAFIETCLGDRHKTGTPSARLQEHTV